MSRTQQLQAQIRNQERRMRRAMESGDVKRLVRMRAKVLPQLLEDIEQHNTQVETIEAIQVAVREAQVLKTTIEAPRLKVTFRKSYAFEAWSEAVLLGRKIRA